MNTQTRNEIISMLVGLLGILIGVASPVPFYIVGLMGLGLYVGTRFLLPTDTEGVVKIKEETLSTGSVISDTDKIKKVIDDIKASSVMIDDTAILARVQGVIKSAKDAVLILEDENSQHDNIKDVYKIVQYLHTLVQKYITLSGHSSELHEFNRAKETFFSLLDNMNQYLSTYYKQGLDADLFDFDAEMKLVDSKIKRNLS